MAEDYARDISAVGRLDMVPAILDILCRTTGMGFAAVARVTEDRWIACAVRDTINFGLKAGDEVPVETTICSEIRARQHRVVIDCVARDADFAQHPTPLMYGFESYISVPIVLPDGRWFGTLCAVDPRPAQLENPATIAMFESFAQLIGAQLLAADALASHDAIRRSDAFTRSVLAASPDCIKVLSADGRVEFMNERGVEMNHLVAASDVVGLDFAAMWPADEQDKIRQAIAAARDGAIARVEGFCPTARGEPRWWDACFAAFTAGHESEVKIVCVSRDVTDRTRAEAALRASEQDLKMALVAGGFGTWTLDVATLAFTTSPTCRSNFGRDPDAPFTYADLHAAVHPDDRARVNAAVERTVSTGEDYDIEYRIVPPNGDEGRAVAIRAHAVRDAKGAVSTMVGVCSDVSTRKQMETELVALNGDLETRVAERTAELLQAQETLRQSQKMEAVGQLTGGVAHDFNNLLTVIRGSIDVLRRPGLDDQRRARYMDAISDTADRAIKLTSQLLAFSRRQPLTPEVFDVGAGVEGVREMVRTLTGADIEMATHLCEEACFTLADPSQFDTALVNMIINARDAMSGKGRLEIKVAPTDAIPAIRDHPRVPGDYVSVSVADSGTGIAPETIARIFDPFFTTKGVGLGTGLGLSQVFGFAKQSNGEILVESEIGKGSTFTLFLPRAERTVSKPTVAPGTTIRGGESCILVVEDNEYVGRFVRDTLAELGHNTHWVTNGTDALAALNAAPGRFDAILSDVMMPGMNGIEFAQKVRRDRPSLPILLTSGYSDALIDDGAAGFMFLRKPFSAEQLSKTLHEAIARSVEIA